MNEKYTPKKVARASVASVLGLGMALTLGLPAASALEDARLFQGSVDDMVQSGHQIGDQVISPSMQAAEGQVSVFVQFRGKGAYESTQPDSVLQGEQATAVDAQAQVQAIAAAVEKQGQSAAAAAGADVIYTAHNTVRGVALRGDAAKIRELASRSDVVKISPIVAKYPSNAGSAIDTKAIASWQQTGFTGEGVKIAVIDTGIDYTHTQFGGPGTSEAYAKASASSEMPAADSGLYDPEKFIGGYDLAGDDYGSKTRVPQPDGNPLDCKAAGHGTHVAGTAAGYAVNPDGSTFKGDYTKITEDQMRDMKIGAGTAPGAQLVGLRVFGCEGSTDLTGLALDRALDPNGDGKYDDRVDVVNMSLGSDFGAIDDPENAMVDALTRYGILSVVAAGNSSAAKGNGDTYSVSGNPANAVSALAVANSIGSTTYVDKAEVTAPSDLAGQVKGSYSVSFDYAAASEEELSGTVVAAPENNKFACDAFPAGTDFGGKWVFIDWTDNFETFPCGSKVRFDNLEKAGAKGVVLASNLEIENIGIAGNATIPGIRLSKSDAEKVRPAAQAGNLKIKLQSDWVGSLVVDSEQFDRVNESSGRGVHGSQGFTKPDVAAPGTNIGSAAVGSGNGKAIFTGTSMASPHVAGIAALVYQAHQNYSAPQVKAAIMNSAVHDLKTADGAVQSVERVGSGRVDALQAVNQNVLVYNSDTPAQVSESFGVVEVLPTAGVQSYTRDLTVENYDSVAHTYALSFEASSKTPGVTVSTPGSVTVQPGQKAQVTVTVTVDPAQLAKTLDPASRAEQLDFARQYLSIESGRLLLTEGDQQTRLPIQIAPKPVADMKAASSSIEFANDASQAKIDLEGSPVDQGGYTSLVGAYQLGAKSDRIQSSRLGALTSQRVDLQYVGAYSNVPELEASGGDIAKDGIMTIGLSTWANWENLTPTTAVEVGIDLDGDNRADYVVMTQRLPGLDYPLVYTTGYDKGQLTLLDVQPLNGALGDVDTNTFDSNVMALPVKLSAIGLDEAKAKNLRYSVSTYSWYEPSTVDQTDWISYNPYSPELTFSGKSSDAQGLFVDAPDADITVDRQGPGSATNNEALLLHFHNASGDLTGTKSGEDGAKAEVLNVTETSPSVVEGKPRFTDVKPGDQFYKEISWLADQKITTGYPDGTFRPLNKVERGAMAAFFYRMAGSPQYTAPSESPFSDVPTSHQFYKEIAWMHDMGITTGYPDGTFRPQANVNRDAMAAFFYRMAGEPAYAAPADSKFSDVKPGDQFYKEISWLNSVGITTGWEDGSFRPVTPIARDAMAAFIYRYDQNVVSR
ncbi:S8 family serine peptidase [Rothia sp. CCM 9417]|uniref:S8 family serine peptidase n=1 Tax=Rothia sp. CCM 9417 TaxID=3402657 RepID=UPI003AE0A079